MKPTTLPQDGFECRFGAHVQQRCVVLPPDVAAHGPAAYQLVCFVHGGFWRAEKTPESMQWLAKSIARSGISAACVGYRTVESGSGLAQMLTDLRLGIAAAAAESFCGLQPRILLVGHSAGGYLALRMLPQLPRVDVVALAPVTLFDSPRYSEIGGHAAAVLWANSSPPAGVGIDDLLNLTTVLDNNIDSDLLIVHGTADQTVPPAMTTQFALRATRAMEVHLVDGATHMDLVKEGRAGSRYVLSLLSALASAGTQR